MSLFRKAKHLSNRGRKQSTKVGLYVKRGVHGAEIALEKQSNGVFVSGYIRSGRYVRSHFRRPVKKFGKKKKPTVTQGKGI